MNKKNLIFVTGLSLLLGLVSLVGIKNTCVLKTEATLIENKITVDPNDCWGGGSENYKVAAYIFDDNSHSAWTDLATITAPSTYVELPFKIEFEARFIRLYRYNVDFSKVKESYIQAVASYAKATKAKVWMSSTVASDKLDDSAPKAILPYFNIVAHLTSKGTTTLLQLLKVGKNKDIPSELKLDSKTLLITNK